LGSRKADRGRGAGAFGGRQTERFVSWSLSTCDYSIDEASVIHHPIEGSATDAAAAAVLAVMVAAAAYRCPVSPFDIHQLSVDNTKSDSYASSPD